MVRNIVLFSGSSHPQLSEAICTHLGIPTARIHLSKFSVGETRVEIAESVREKDVFIVQTGAGHVNDHLMELLITISACKTASAKKVTAVLPLFPYSRQSDLPYNKVGAPLARMPTKVQGEGESKYTFDTRPGTPVPGGDRGEGSGFGYGNGGAGHLHRKLNSLTIARKERDGNGDSPVRPPGRKNTGDSLDASEASNGYSETSAVPQPAHNPPPTLQTQRGYKQWVAQAGTLVADLLTCAGADHIITMDLHDPQYQGFFDIPVDNLYGRHLLRRYIQQSIVPRAPRGADGCVIVSPDAGGAKRATNIADSLGMDFALIHKERRPTYVHDRQNASLLLVGQVANRTAILIDDLADTSNTITRAAKLLKKEGATRVFALVTHGVFSGDAVERINASAIDKVVVTNSVPQEEHLRNCPKLEVLEIGNVFAEAIRRVHHGESISVLFQYD
ncbi:phosphoribosyl pyrophosphokinase [Polychaeton citri CBS 116435]|uniref:Phosphoribosyl pyrophosphokinase n=1 Tax=Polychaeton citri CBS 116435 TaxID=1314669 RepID=A0A9P4Q5C8_9PEZI|nr:phosphoribosyl pyrophosphokinase [Polychaeton citri CBS 116435]